MKAQRMMILVFMIPTEKTKREWSKREGKNRQIKQMLKFPTIL